MDAVCRSITQAANVCVKAEATMNLQPPANAHSCSGPGRQWPAQWMLSRTSVACTMDAVCHSITQAANVCVKAAVSIN
eukprot:1138965-Pelagomonas_calceolata.AAC.2